MVEGPIDPSLNALWEAHLLRLAEYASRRLWCKFGQVDGELVHDLTSQTVTHRLAQLRDTDGVTDWGAAREEDFFTTLQRTMNGLMINDRRLARNSRPHASWEDMDLSAWHGAADLNPEEESELSELFKHAIRTLREELRSSPIALLVVDAIEQGIFDVDEQAALTGLTTHQVYGARKRVREILRRLLSDDEDLS